ncbi:MAG: peptidylprolyl isomerase [Bacteroidetes bacterium]|nr:peptidylprolyl isomerase [Bacteroidota bacterium]
MEISKNKVVSVHYKLDVDGETVDQSGDQPLTYLHGHQMMIPGFERQLEGLQKGQPYNFTVESHEGYGERNDEAIAELDKSIFMVDGKISDQVYQGAQLQMRNEEGHPLVGTVVEIGEDHVTMDFNHMLAGKSLNFSGTVEEVREATADEISHGHVHGPGGHHH